MQRESGQGNDLNVSLFERLISEGMPYKSLVQQHRMRPAISALVRDIAYPGLIDGPLTSSRPPLRGVPPGNDVLFLAHAWPESGDDAASSGRRSSVVSSASKTNPQEARLAVAVLKYVLQQGYKVEEVALLTTYLGQLRLIRELMREAGIQEVLDERDAGDLAALGDWDDVRPCPHLHPCYPFLAAEHVCGGGIPAHLCSAVANAGCCFEPRPL